MLDEIKQNYASIIFDNTLSDESPIDLVDKYFSADTCDKSYYFAQLILYCWPVLERLFYKQRVKILSEEDCYDIFIDAFLYVIQQRVWKDVNSSLYKDKDALLKAMYTTVESRRKNFFVAQNRQKRQANQFPISLDEVAEDFQEGYFSSILDSYHINKGWSIKYISTLWNEKLYVSAIVFHILLTCDVYTKDNNKINIKKIKKLLKHFDEMCYNNFIHEYGLYDNDNMIYHQYIENMSDTIIYQFIYSALYLFRTSDTLKELYNNQMI